MFKIDSEGATIDNKFTEGDPALSVPATVVSADWANAVQGELVKVVEEMGITLDKNDSTQLYQALLEMFLRGGRKLAFEAALANSSGPFDVQDANNGNALLTIDKTKHHLKAFFFDIERSTDTSTVKEYGVMFLSYNEKSDSFEAPRFLSLNGDGGVTFSLVEVDVDSDDYKLQATTNDLTGTTYVGRLSLTSIIEIKQTA